MKRLPVPALDRVSFSGTGCGRPLMIKTGPCGSASLRRNGIVAPLGDAAVSASSSGHHESGTPCPLCCICRIYNPGGHGNPDRSAAAVNTSRISVQTF
jgi:hypothetical protein